MATTLGKLILELGIDDSKIAGQLADAKKNALASATSVEKDLKKLKIQDAISTSPEIDNSEFSPKLQKLEEDISKLSDRIEYKLNSLDASNVNKQLHLVPSVDHTPLEELNAHLDKKLKHVLTLNQEFALNPLRVNVDSRDLDTLTSKLNNIGNRTEKIAVTTEGIDDLVPLSEEDIYKKLLRELDDTGVPTVSSQATSQKLQNTSKVNDLESVMSDLIQQNEGLALSNQNLALAMRGLDSSIQANSAVANDMPVKMSKIIHTSSKESLMDKITGFPARAFETVVFGAFEGTGAQLAYDFVKGAQRYVEGKTGVDAETVGYNFGRYGYNRTKGLAMVGAEAMGYRGGLKEVGDDIAYLGKRLDSFLDPRKVVARLKGFEDLVVATLEDVHTYNNPERAKDRVVEYFKPEVEELKEGAARAAGVGLRAVATPFRIRKRANLATSMEYSRILAESMEVPDIPDVENKKAIALVSGGVDLKEGGPNTYMATAMLKNLFGDQVATVPVPNSYSNDADMMGAQKMLRQILANIAADFTGNEDIRTAGDTIAMDRLYNIAYESGFNPDAIAMEATRLAHEKKYGSDKQFIFAGTSAGTTVAEEATAISERAGATNVKGFGATLPLTGLTNTASKENFKAFVGTLDPMFLALMGNRLTDEGAESKGTLKILEASLSHFPSILQTMIKEKWNSGLMAPSANTEVIEGAGLLHNLGPFLANEEFQSRLSDFLGIQLSDDARGRTGQTANKSYADMFGELDALSRTLRALQGDKTALDEIKRFEDTGGKEGGYGFVTSELQLKKSTGPSQEKYDLEYALDNFRNSGKGGKAPSKMVTGKALEDANLFQVILEDMINILKDSTADLAGQRENLARTLGILQGNESAIEDAQSGKYAYVTPEGQLKKSFGESQEKYDLEYAIDEFDTKGDGELEKVKSLMQGIVDLTKDADSLDNTKLNSLVSDMQEMINSVSEINLIEIEKLMAKLGEIFGVAPNFDQFTIQDIEDLAQGKKSFTQLREEAKARGEEFPEGSPQPIEERASNLPARKFETTETRTRDAIAKKKQQEQEQEQEFNKKRRDSFSSIYGNDTDLALSLYPRIPIDTLEQISNNQKSINTSAFAELSRLNLENNTQTLDLNSVNIPTVDNILSPVNISQPELQATIASTEEASATGSEMALSFVQGVGTGLANVAESAGNAMATATENKLVSLINRLMRRVPGDPNSIDANAPTIESLSDIGPEQIARASALGVEDAATALTNVAKGGVAAAKALIEVSKAAGIAITGAQPAATEFIESSRQRMQAIRSSVSGIRNTLSAASPKGELPPELTQRLQYLIGETNTENSQDEGYINKFLSDIDNAIAQLPSSDRTRPLEGNQLSNLKSQLIKIEKELQKFAKYISEIQVQDEHILEGEIIQEFNNLTQIPGSSQQQVAQLTAAQPPPDTEKLLQKVSSDFVDLARIAQKGKSIAPRGAGQEELNRIAALNEEEKKVAAKKIKDSAEEAYRNIESIQSSLGQNTPKQASATKGQITRALNIANQIDTTDIGDAVGDGIVEGMSGRLSLLKSESERYVEEGVKNPIKSGLDIQSPSGVTTEYGKNTLQGFINGIQSKFGDLKSTVTEVKKIVDTLGEDSVLAARLLTKAKDPESLLTELEKLKAEDPEKMRSVLQKGIKLVAEPYRENKRAQLPVSALRAQELSTQIKVPELKEPEKIETIVLVSGGLDLDAMANSTTFMSQVIKHVFGDKAHVVPVDNTYMNRAKPGGELEASTGMANSGTRALTFATEYGYNPDSIKMEATRLAYERKYPDKNFVFTGGSGGTFTAEEATAIAEYQGAENTQGFGLTFGLTGLTNLAERFNAYVGELDTIFLSLYGTDRLKSRISNDENLSDVAKKRKLNIAAEVESSVRQMLIDAFGDIGERIANLVDNDLSGIFTPSSNTQVFQDLGMAHAFAPFLSDKNVQDSISNQLGSALDYDPARSTGRQLRDAAGVYNEDQNFSHKRYELGRTLALVGDDRQKRRQAQREVASGQYAFVGSNRGKLKAGYGTPDIEGFLANMEQAAKKAGAATEDAKKFIDIISRVTEALKVFNQTGQRIDTSLLDEANNFLEDFYGRRVDFPSDVNQSLEPTNIQERRISGIDAVSSAYDIEPSRLKLLNEGHAGEVYSDGNNAYKTSKRDLSAISNEARILPRLTGLAPEFRGYRGGVLAQEQLQGQDLGQVIQSPDIDVSDVEDYIKKAGELLKKLHELKVTHDDFHAGNIFVTPEGFKAIDFGAARSDVNQSDLLKNAENSREYLANSISKLLSKSQNIDLQNLGLDKNRLKALFTQGYGDIGNNLTSSLASGIDGKEVIQTIDIMATQVIDTIKKEWQISSPSKKGFNLGRWLAEGIKQGIEKTLDVSASIAQVTKDLYSMADMYQENLVKAFDSKVITDELAILRDSITEALTAIGQLEDASPAIQNAKTAAGRIINYPNEAIVAKYKEDVRSNAQRILTEPPDPDTHPAAHNIPADAKKVIFVSSGFTGTKGRISNEIAEKLEPMAPKGVHMVPFENKNFDVSGTLDEAGIARVVMDAIIMPMKAVKQGVNEEALRLAKQAYAVKQERPDVEIGFVGHSAGGFIVREAQEILRAMGIFSQALSMGTPLLGAFQAIKPNTVSLMGEKDQLRVFTGQKEAIVPGVSGHFSPHYLDESNEMREILTKYLHDGITPELISRIHELGSAIKGLEPGNSGPVMRFDRIRSEESNSLLSNPGLVELEAIATNTSASLDLLDSVVNSIENIPIQTETKINSQSNNDIVKSTNSQDIRVSPRRLSSNEQKLSPQGINEFIDVGENINEGLAQGINKTTKLSVEAASQMANSVIDITEKTFEVKSPSEWAKRVGKFITQGLANGIQSGENKVSDAINGIKESAKEAFDDWINTPTEDDFVPIEWNTKRPEADIPIIGGAYAFVLDSMESMKNMATALPEIGRGLAGVFEGVMQNTPAIMNMAKGFLVFDFIIKPLISSLLAFEEVAFQTAVEMENMTNVIELVSGSAAEGAKNIAFVRSQVQALGGDMRASMEGFSQLGASAQGTRLEGEGTRQIFSAVSQAALVYQMDPEAQGRAYTALSQMMDKSVVSAEELRGQLAESLPGAIAVAARAMGVSTQELGKMMEMGEVMAEDLLPRFAQQLSAETAGGLAGSARSAQSSINKLNNEMLLLQEAYGKTTIPIRVVGMDAASAGLRLVRENILALSVALTALIVTLLKNSVIELVKFLTKFAAIKSVMDMIKNAAKSLWKFLIPMIKQLGVAFLKQFLLLTAIGDVFTIFQKGFGDASGGMADTAKSTTDAWQSYLNVLEEARKKQEELSKGDSSGFSFERFKESGGVDSAVGLTKILNPIGTIGLGIKDAFTGIDGSSESYVKFGKSLVGYQQILDISKDAKNFFSAFVDGIGISDDLKQLLKDESIIESTLVGNILGEEISRVVENGMHQSLGAIQNATGVVGGLLNLIPVTGIVRGLGAMGLDLGTSYGDIQRQQRDIAVGEQVTSGGNIQQEARTTLFDLEGNAINDLAKVVDLDEQYRQAQQRRAALPREAIEEQRKAEEEINRILEERGVAYQAVGKQQANLQLSVENYKAQIKSVEEELATLGNSDKDNERRQQLQGQLALLKSNMNDSQLLLDNINAKIGEAASRVELLARQFRLVNAELQNASYALELQTAQQQAMLTAIPAGQEGLSQGTSNVVQQEQLAERIGINANFINQTQTLLNDQEYIQTLESAGLKATSTAADIAAKVEELADGSLKTNLTKIQEAKEQLQQTELESAQLGAQMAELKQQLDEQFFQMGIQLEDMMIEIGQQVELLEAEFKAAANDRKIQSAARGIGRSMKLLRTDHFSGFMGLLEEFVSVLGEQLRTTADFLRQKIELTQNLFNQLRQNDMFNLGIPQVDGSVVGGGQGGSGGSSVFQSGLFTGPSANIGGSAAYHIDTKIQKSIGADRAIELIDQMARGYAEIGRRMEFSNDAVSGLVWDTTASIEQKREWLDRIDRAHSHSPNPGTWDLDYYIPEIGQSRHGETARNAEILLPEVAGGSVRYGQAGNYGNFAVIRDANGQELLRTGHGDNRRALPGNRTFSAQPVQQASSPQFQGTTGLGASSSASSLARATGQSEQFVNRVIQMAGRLGTRPEYLLAVMGFETGGTFSTSVRNRAGSGATGLIQFMPDTARSLGTSTSALARMSQVEQLEYVERYLQPYAGRLDTLEDTYMSVLYPAAIGRGASHGLFRQGTTAYRQNRGLDINRDGTVTVGESTQKVRAYLPGGTGLGATSAPAPQQSQYERFMREGYALTDRGDYQSALINFRRALQERPNDRYATQAINNVTGYINRGRQSSQPNLPGAMTGGSPQTTSTTAQQPAAPQVDVASINAQSQGLLQRSGQYRNDVITLHNQQIAEINRLQQFANQQFNLDLGNIVSRAQQDAVIKDRDAEDAQRILDDQNEDREFLATPEYARTPEMIARQDTREATRAARDEGIQIDRQIEDLRFDIAEVERRLPETASILRGLGAPEEFVRQMEQAGQSVITSAREKIAVLEQQRGNIDTFLTDTVNRIAAEAQRALENTQFQNASDIANLNADLMEEQATRAGQTGDPQEAARLRAAAEEVRAIRSNEELIRDLQQRMEADPTNAAQYQEQIDTAQQKIAVSLENLNETFRRTSEEIAQYNFSASRESNREVRALEIQQLRFNGDPMQALIMEQEDQLNAQLDEFQARRLKIAADVQLDGPTRAQLEADLAEIEAMTIEMTVNLMLRAQVELEIANENALLDARATNLQALIPNLNANYEQGRARDMQAELDGLMIEQRLRETLHSIEDSSNNLTEETKERLRLLAEETAELEKQNLERNHALQIRRDQIEIDRNTITNPGGPQALAQVQDEYLGMFGITPTYAMKQERLPMQLEMQNLNYQQQLLDLEELRNSGKLTQEAFEKAKLSLEAMNNIKLDQLRIEASGIPEIVNSVKGPMQGFFKEMLDPNSTKTFGEAFSDMINGMLANLAQLAAEWVTNSLFSSFLGGGAGSPGKEGGLFSTLFGGGGEEEEGAVDPALAAISAEGDPATALAMGGQEASMNLTMGAQEAANMLIQAGIQFAQSVQSSAMSASMGANGGGYNWGGMAGVTRPTGWLEGMTAFSAPAVRSGGGLPGFDMNNLNFTFARGAQTIGNSIVQSSSQGANSFGGGIANALQGATRNVGSLFGGDSLFGGGGNKGKASGGGGGGFFGALLQMGLGFLTGGFNTGGVVTSDRAITIPNFAKGGKLGGIADNAIAEAFKRERPYGKPRLIMANEGEWVLNRKQQAIAKSMGVDERILNFAGGGIVGSKSIPSPVVNTSNIGGTTSNVSVPITINGGGGSSAEDDAKLAKQLKEPIEGLVRSILQRNQRFGGDMYRR